MWNSSIPTHFLIFSLIFAFVLAEEEQQSKKAESDGIAKLNRPDVAICEGTLSAFFVSDNVNIRGATNASAIIGGVNEKQCIDFCAKNQDHKGRTVLCASVVYQNEAQQCRMYRRASFPDGELLRKSEDGHRYFEKFCLPEDAPAHCANRQFVRVDEYILKGYAQSTTTVPTMAECAAYCMHEREYECKSAMYFYEEGECITNVESAITAPDDFQRPDDEDKVIFFHNGCILPGAGTAGPPGEFELAQSQDATSTIGVPSSSISPLQQSEDGSGPTSSAAESETTTVQLPTVSSSPSPSYSPSGISQQQKEEKESPQPSDPNTVPSSSPVAIISSSSTMPDMADGIPSSSSDLPVEEKHGQNDENDNSNGKRELARWMRYTKIGLDWTKWSSKTINDEPQRESSAEGQKLEESKATETTNDEPNEGERLKAVAIPMSNLPEESSSTHRLHPKHLALPPLADEGNAGDGEGGIGGEKEANENNEQQQRQYGAKTIERASDGSFQEKAAGTGPIAPPKAAAGLATNRKGPESTKRLHLKLIKDQQQQPKPNITNINIGHSSFPSSTSEPSLPLATSTEQQQNENSSGNEKENIARISSTSKTEEEGQNGSQQQQIIVPDESPEEQFQGTEGFFSRWGAWTPCHVPGERRVRRRKCLDLRRCKGALMQVDYCPRDIPPESAEDTMTLEGQPQQQLAHQAADQQKLNPIPAVVHSDGPSHPIEVSGNIIPEGPPSNNNKNDGMAPVPIINLQVGQMVGGGLDGGAQPPAIMPPSQNGEGKNAVGQQQIEEEKQQQPIPVGAPAPRPSEEEAAAIWSPWNGTCQHFASSQPCKDGQVIGFESRECIAKDPLACKGPFFRYCTLPC